MCLNSYRYQISLFFRVCVCVGVRSVCVSVDKHKGAPPGSVYLHIAVPQKEEFITMPEGAESTTVMMSNRLSALYMNI